MKFTNSAAFILLALSSVDAFATQRTTFTRNGFAGSDIANQNNSALNMAAGGKKKRRRRKQPSAPITDIDMPIPEGSSAASGEDLPSIDELKSIANFSPDTKKSIDAAVPTSSLTPVGDGYIETKADNTLVELPDIRNVLKNKELKKLEDEEEEKRARPKISRNDRKAMLQVSFHGSDMKDLCYSLYR